MNYSKAFFDICPERRGTRSVKWDSCNERFGVDPAVQMLPMWIAEMCGAQYGMGFYVKKFSDFGMYNKVWLGFLFMVIVMQLFEKLKDRLLKWTIN